MKKADISLDKVYAFQPKEWDTPVPLRFLGSLDQLWSDSDHLWPRVRGQRFEHAWERARPSRSDIYGATGYAVVKVRGALTPRAMEELRSATLEDFTAIQRGREDSARKDRLWFEIMPTLVPVRGVFEEVMRQRDRQRESEETRVAERERERSEARAQADRQLADLKERFGLKFHPHCAGRDGTVTHLMISLDDADELIQRLTEGLPGYSCVDTP